MEVFNSITHYDVLQREIDILEGALAAGFMTEPLEKELAEYLITYLTGRQDMIERGLS